MATATDFAKMVPGFDFLQGLMKGAGNSLPNIGQWIAPTLDPAELEKRIQELKTVQFWLEQNARMLGATIQALEVQRMTLATLKTMNMPVAEVRKAFEMKPAAPAPAPAAAAPAAPPPAPKARPKPAAKKAAAEAGATPVAGTVDPMQWWSALTRQFGELAANAVKDSGAAAMSGAAAAAPKKAAPRARRGG